jgi:hypothetical protein
MRLEQADDQAVGGADDMSSRRGSFVFSTPDAPEECNGTMVS